MVASNTDHSGSTVLEQVGPNIIHHVSNSDITHPIVFVPKLYGLDFSITKLILEGPKEVLDQTENTQPSIFLVSFSIFQLIKKEFSAICVWFTK